MIDVNLSTGAVITFNVEDPSDLARWAREQSNIEVRGFSVRPRSSADTPFPGVSMSLPVPKHVRASDCYIIPLVNSRIGGKIVGERAGYVDRTLGIDVSVIINKREDGSVFGRVDVSGSHNSGRRIQ